MQVDRARNCFLDLHGKFSLSLSEILKKVVWPQKSMVSFVTMKVHKSSKGNRSQDEGGNQK